MARFEYKDGCLLCNQCGRLTKPPEVDDSGRAECPCGNSESLEAIEELIHLYNDSDPRPARPEQK